VRTEAKRCLSVGASAILLGFGAGALTQRCWDVPFAPRRHAQDHAWSEAFGKPVLSGRSDTARAPTDAQVAASARLPAARRFLRPQGEPDWLIDDPLTGHLHRPGARRVFPWPEHAQGRVVMACNNLGLREDAPTDVAVPANRRRVLVTGDSHTDGVVDNGETFPNVLEALLARGGAPHVEVLNGGVGHYGPHHYLGFLWKYVSLQPAVYCVALYTGNDFLDAIMVGQERGDAFVPRRPDQYGDALRGAVSICAPAIAQALNQVAFFRAFPELERTAVDIALAQLLGAYELCLQRRIAMVVVLLPSKLDIDWVAPRYDDVKARLLAALALGEADLGANARLAQTLARRLSGWGVRVVDLQPFLREHEPPLYWDQDYHLNVRGHLAVAQALERELGSLLRGE
jgi:hypothetical protein